MTGTHPASARRPRASAMTASGDTGPPTNTTRGVVGELVPVGEHVGEGGRARPVEHQAERTVVAVFEHEDHGAVEVRIDERRRSRRVGVRARAGSVPNPRPSLGAGAQSRSLLATCRPAPRTSPTARRSRERPSARSTCSPIPISPGATSIDWTGRFRGRDAGRRAAGRRRRGRPCRANVRRGARRGGAPGRQHRPRRRFGAVARRDRPVACAASTRSVRSTRRAAQVTAGAGATLAAVQAHARAAGWEYGVDLGARDSATIGGNIATNAGGVHVLRYGPTRRQVVGVQAVLAERRRHRTARRAREGQHRLRPRRAALRQRGHAGRRDRGPAPARPAGRARRRRAARLRDGATTRSMRSAGCAVTSTGCARSRSASRRGSTSSASSSGSPPPFPRRARRVRAGRGGRARRSRPTRWPRSSMRSPVSRDAAVATDARGAEALWRYREAHAEAINRLGPPHKLDVTLAAEHLPEFFARVRSGRRGRRARRAASGCSGTRATATCT